MARTGYGKHSTQVDTSQYPDDPSVPIGSDEWNAEPSDSGMLGFTSETISSASSITPSNTVINISGSTNVSTISQGNTNEYDLLYVFTSGTVTLEHGTGNIQLLGGSNKDLSSTVPTILMRKGSSWYEYGGSGTVEMGGTMTSHIIPDTNDTYDIGSAEYKIRDMYVADNSLWVGDDHKVEVQNGKMKFKKRKKNTTPTSIENAGGNSAGALASSGRASLEQMTLNDWVVYGKSLGGSLANAKPNDIFTSDNADDWESDDATIPQKGTAGKILGYNASTGILEEQEISGGVVEEENISFPHSTTNSDYSNPTSHSASSHVITESTNYGTGFDGTWAYPWGSSGTYSYTRTYTIGDNYVKVLTLDLSTGGYGSGLSTPVVTIHKTDGTTQTVNQSSTTTVNAYVNRVTYYFTGNKTRNGNRNITFSDGSSNYTSENTLGDLLSGGEAKTNSEINPSFTQNLTSTNVSGVYISTTGNNTCTTYKLEAWVDGSWKLLRTLTLLGYIRFNAVTTDKIKLTGTDGTSKVMALNSFKNLPKTTDDIFSHGHVVIDPTDSSLGLDGT